jgi:hypothetical protein
MGRPHARRDFLRLSGAVAVTTTGCLFAENADVADLFLDNDRDQDVEVTTVVTRVSDEAEILNDTTTIPEDESHEYEDPISEEVNFQLRVSTADGLENRLEWEATGDEATGLWVTIAQDEIDIGSYAA